MKKEILQIKIEEAKSWFALAQILIILAGFTFTASGIYYVQGENSKEKISNKVLEILKISLENKDKPIDEDISHLIKMYADEAYENVEESKRQESHSRNFMIIGIILMIVSISLYIIGRISLKRITPKL